MGDVSGSDHSSDWAMTSAGFALSKCSKLNKTKSRIYFPWSLVQLNRDSEIYHHSRSTENLILSVGLVKQHERQVFYFGGRFWFVSLGQLSWYKTQTQHAHSPMYQLKKEHENNSNCKAPARLMLPRAPDSKWQSDHVLRSDMDRLPYNKIKNMWR